MRYFIVFYQGLYEPKGWDKGNIDLCQKEYPNRNKCKEIGAKHAGLRKELIIITNIIELTEQDYNEWVR